MLVPPVLSNSDTDLELLHQGFKSWYQHFLLSDFQQGSKPLCLGLLGGPWASHISVTICKMLTTGPKYVRWKCWSSGRLLLARKQTQPGQALPGLKVNPSTLTTPQPSSAISPTPTPLPHHIWGAEETEYLGIGPRNLPCHRAHPEGGGGREATGFGYKQEPLHVSKTFCLLCRALGLIGGCGSPAGHPQTLSCSLPGTRDMEAAGCRPKLGRGPRWYPSASSPLSHATSCWVVLVIISPPPPTSPHPLPHPQDTLYGKDKVAGLREHTGRWCLPGSRPESRAAPCGTGRQAWLKDKEPESPAPGLRRHLGPERLWALRCLLLWERGGKACLHAVKKDPGPRHTGGASSLFSRYGN